MPRSDVAIAGALHEEAEPADSVEKIRDAAEFLLASSLCSDAKYSWVLPLVRPILTNAEEHPNVASYLESIFSPEESSSSSESIETTAPPSATADSSESISPQTPVRMRQLTEISSVQNIGLLSTKQSIPLKDGLNVFYGKKEPGRAVSISRCVKFWAAIRSFYRIATNPTIQIKR